METELKKLYQEMQVTIQDKDKEINNLQTVNTDLSHYISSMENFAYKDISEVSKKSRTFKSFLSRAQSALWFATSFGLELRSLTVRETKAGRIHKIASEVPSGHEARHTSGFESLSLEEKSNVEKVLFLLDKFCIGDSFYHELTMTMGGLPKSYLVKQRRDQLNNICHITCTPGTAEGAQVLFCNLLKARLKDYLASHPDGYKNTIRIKISGDGARMTRNSSFILMTFALIDLGDDVMAAKGNHTIAVVKGKEDYNTLQESFANVFKETVKRKLRLMAGLSS